MKRHIRVTAEILRHPRTPWYVRALAVILVAYAASPIDLIPDFIPIIGYLDDLILLPIGIVLVMRLTPHQVRVEAARASIRSRPTTDQTWRWIVPGIIVALWVAGIAMLVRWIARLVMQS